MTDGGEREATNTSGRFHINIYIYYIRTYRYLLVVVMANPIAMASSLVFREAGEHPKWSGPMGFYGLVRSERVLQQFLTTSS